MASIVIPSNGTTLTLNGTRIADLAEGDCIVVTPINEETSKTIGINGGVSIKDRLDGKVTDVVIRVLKFSESDIFLNNMINQATPEIVNGSLKRNFKRDGTDGVETYTFENGTVTSKPSNTVNLQDGQEIMEYTINFISGIRVI